VIESGEPISSLVEGAAHAHHHLTPAGRGCPRAGPRVPARWDGLASHDLDHLPDFRRYLLRGTKPPKTEKDWNDLQAQALTLAESGNLLMMGRRARDQGDWIKESQELVDVGAAAYKAALAKDLPAIVALNQRLNDACVACHQQYRPNYRRRKQDTK